MAMVIEIMVWSLNVIDDSDRVEHTMIWHNLVESSGHDHILESYISQPSHKMVISFYVLVWIFQNL